MVFAQKVYKNYMDSKGCNKTGTKFKRPNIWIKGKIGFTIIGGKKKKCSDCIVQVDEGNINNEYGWPFVRDTG